MLYSDTRNATPADNHTLVTSTNNNLIISRFSESTYKPLRSPLQTNECTDAFTATVSSVVLYPFALIGALFLCCSHSISEITFTVLQCR